MSREAYREIRSRRGSRVTRVVPDTIPAGSPIWGTATTKSTRVWLMEMLGMG